MIMPENFIVFVFITYIFNMFNMESRFPVIYMCNNIVTEAGFFLPFLCFILALFCLSHDIICS
jgi:hypothetical protein